MCCLAVMPESEIGTKPDQHCAFHQGAPGHDIENFFTLNAKVRRLMKSGILSYEDSNLNV